MAEASWLVKDFNVLYRVTRDLLRAVGEGEESKTARALDAVAVQLTRLHPAFAVTEVIRIGLPGDPSAADIDTAIAIVAKAQAKARGS